MTREKDGHSPIVGHVGKTCRQCFHARVPYRMVNTGIICCRNELSDHYCHVMYYGHPTCSARILKSTKE